MDAESLVKFSSDCYTKPELSLVSPPELKSLNATNQIGRQDSEPIEQGDLFPRLTNRQSQVAKLAIEGRSYASIADELHLSAATVRTHLRDSYSILGVSSKAQLAALAPCGDINDDDLAGLSSRERNIFECIAFGLTYKQTANKCSMSASTVRSHSHNIRQKLRGINNQIELTRAAVHHGKKFVETATCVQGATMDILKNVEKHDELAALKRAKGRRPLNNDNILKKLHETGYITRYMREKKCIGLKGLVAAFLLKREITESMLSHPDTEIIAREVIENEVRLFHARQAGLYTT